MADKRLEKRHRKRVKVRYGEESPAKVAFTEDVSEGGLFIKTALVARPSSTLKLEITTSDNETISVEGRVQWARKVPPNLLMKTKGGMGIRFSSFSSGEENYRKLIDALNINR